MNNLCIVAFGEFGELHQVVEIRLVGETGFQRSDLLTAFFKGFALKY
jgi:hypothetical protein